MTTQEVINGWLDETQKGLIDNYYRLKLKASGNWPNQLEQFQKETGKGYEIGIKGEKYTGAIEFGRLPNKNQSTEAIKKWVGWAGSTFIKKWGKDKGIDINPFAVAYKIAKQGWRVPNRYNAGGLVDDVVKEQIPKLQKDLTFAKVNEIKTDLINTLKYGYYNR